MTAAGSNFAFKIAAKPLQIKTWLLMTAYIKSPSLYPMIPLPTPYDVPFSHSTCVTDRQTTHDISYPRNRGNKIMQIFTKLGKYCSKIIPVCLFFKFLFIFFNNLKWGISVSCFSEVRGVNVLALLYFAKIGGCMYAG